MTPQLKYNVCSEKIGFSMNEEIRVIEWVFPYVTTIKVFYVNPGDKIDLEDLKHFTQDKKEWVAMAS